MIYSQLRRRRGYLTATRLALLSCGSGLVMATAAQAGDPAAGPQAGQVAEVVVTAQKRSENLQKVPLSIQNVSAAALERIGAKDVRDIESLVPSVSFGDGSEQGRTGIRGILDYSRNAGYDSRVGVDVDGVYLGRSYLNNQMLLGVQQIDVLRGPQGTLFGKDTDAGVISITTRKPTDQFSAQLVAEAGNFGEYRLAGIVNGQVAPDVDAQAAITQQGSRGYYHNVLLDKWNDGTDQLGGRAQVRYQPNDRLEILVSGDDTHQHNSTLHYSYIPPAGSNVYDFSSYNDDYAIVNSYGGSVTVNYALASGYKLTSITASRGGTQTLDFNNETGPKFYFTPYFHEVTSQVSEEARIASPIYDHYDFVAGLYYFHQLNNENTKDIIGNVSILGLGIYNNSTIPYGADVTTDSYAAFFNGNLRLNPIIELTAGLRYTDEIKTLSNFYSDDPYGVFGGHFSGMGGRISDSFVTPKGGINLHIWPKVLLFADVGAGFKGGAFNIDNTTKADIAAGIVVKPETVTSYEAGVKSTFLDDRARLNLTAFRENFTNFQVFTFISATLPNQTVVSTTSLANAGTVQSQGVELEGAFVPTQGLTLSTNYTYNDSHFVSYIGGGGKVGATVLNANGAQTPYAPINKAYLSVDYTHVVMSSYSGFLHAGYSVQSSENFDPKHVNPIYGKYYDIPGYDNIDARIGVTAPDKRWTVALWGKNLADSKYIIFANRTAIFSNPAVIYAPPLTYGVTLTANF